MKNLYDEELVVVNGGAAEAEGSFKKQEMTTVCSKEGAKVTMSLDDFYWLVDNYGWCFTRKFTSDQILDILIRHHKMCA